MRLRLALALTALATVFPRFALAAATGTALVRHAPSINGTVDGSVQQMNPESVTLNGGSTITGDLLVPGTPTVRLNGNPPYGGTTDGTGAASPSNYQVTLNGNSALRHVVRRTNAIALPVVSAPPAPAGTRSVTINSAGQSPGSFTTLRNLTLNGNVGQFAVPPGTYGDFTANGGSGFTIGVAGATQPAVYNFQHLTLNGQTQIQVVGPVVVTVASGFTGNGSVGTTTNPAWLVLNVYSGGFTLNGGCNVYGYVNTPNGTAIVNGNSQLIGGVACDALIVNGGGLLRLQSATSANHAPVANDIPVQLNEDTPAAIVLAATDADGNSLTYTVVTPPAHGGLSGTAPNLTYTPVANYNGPDSFTFKANDGQADSNVATVSITVRPINDPPTADSKPLDLDEDTPTAVTLTGRDVDGNALTFAPATLPSHGVLTGTAPNLTYVPAADYSGPDAFTYTAFDGVVTSAPATVTITVRPVNDKPVAENKSYSVNEGASVAIVLTGTDVDTPASALTFARTSNPSNGTLSGTVPNLVYTPNGNFGGTDSFTFTVSDGQSTSTPGTITIQVTDMNFPPVASGGSGTTDEDVPATFTLTGSDQDGDPLGFAVVGAPQHGRLSAIVPAGPSSATVVYTPDADYSGPDSFTFKANDGKADSATAGFAITVRPVNDAPVATDQSAQLDEDTSVTITLAATDVDSANLTFSTLGQPAHGTLGAVTQGANHTATVTYTPNANYNGPDSFTFTANDGAADSTPATVSLTVRPVNDAPTATAQTLETPEDTPLTITLTGADIDSATLSFAIEVTAQHGTLGPIVPGANNTATVVYTPAPDFHGADSFTIRANDGEATSAAATIDINVTTVNDPPVADGGPELVYPQDTPIDFTLTATDPDHDPLTYTIVTPPTHGSLSGVAPNLTYTPNFNYRGTDSLVFRVNDGALNSNDATVNFRMVAVSHAPVATAVSASTPEDSAKTITLPAGDLDGDALGYFIVTQPQHGTLGEITLDANHVATVTYTPARDFSGTDSFTFHAYDGALYSNDAVVSLTVETVNDAPVAAAATATTNEDTAVTITLPASDVDGDPLTYAVVAAPTHGTLGPIVVAANVATVVYTPAANYSGPDAFSFKASDGQVDSNTATVSITVTPVNDAPVAASQTVSTSEDTPLAITLTATDIDSTTLTYAVVAAPQHGTFAGVAPALTYKPAPNYNGPDSFTFKANDGTTDSAPATITINVQPVNDAPVANPLTVATSTGTPTTLTLTGSDIDSATLTFAIATPPQHGSLSVVTSAGSTSATVTYTSAPDFGGFDSFTFVANDGALNSAPATIQLTSGLPPRSKTYTTTADFRGGTLVSVSTDVPDEISNQTILASYDVVWVANSSKGTVVKLDAETGRVMGEYYTTATTVSSPYPSRIAIDSKGNAWVANYSHNSIVKIGLPESGGWRDRNNNGLIDTSTALGELKPWPSESLAAAQDEAILLYVQTGVSNVRHLAIDANDNVWVSGPNGPWEKYDGKTGQLLKSNPNVGRGGMGGYIGPDGRTYSSGTNFLIAQTEPGPITPQPVDEVVRRETWASALDSHGNLWCTRDWTSTVVVYSPTGELLGEFYHGEPWAMGIAIDANDHVWVAHSHCGHTVGHLLPDGRFLGNVPVANHGPVEVSIDRHGRIWVASSTGVAERINPLGGPLGSDGVTPVGEVDVRTGNLGGALWTYGRFTGSTKALASPDGLWTAIYDGKLAGTTWGPAVWNGEVCNDAAITVEAALSADGVNFGPFQMLSVGNSTPAGAGRFLKTRVRLASATTGETPTLYDLTVGTAGYAAPSTTPTWRVEAGPDIAGNWPDIIQMKGAFCHSVHSFPVEPTYVWSKVSGPGTVQFTDPADKRSTARFSAQGTYVLRLTGTLNGQTATSDVTVVLTPYNRAPYANAGYTTFLASFPPQIWLWGEVRDDGLPVGAPVVSTWEKLFGPGTVTFTDASAPATTAAFSTAGVYTLRLKATDGELSSDNTTDVWIGVPPPPLPPDGLVSWWEASGNGDDHISGNQAFTERGAAYNTGKLGGAFKFDGANSRVRVFAAPSLDVGAKDGLTVELWVNPTASRTATLFEYGQGATRGVSLRQLNGNLEANFREASGTDHILTTGNVLPLNTWTHVTASYNRMTGEARIFVNGILQTLQRLAPQLVLRTGLDIYMGARADGQEPYLGLLDEISVYNRAIFADEVTTIVTQGKRPPVSNLPPVVNAGPDLFDQHVNTAVDLAGVVTDDHQPTNGQLTAKWTLVAGPGTVTFANDAAPHTTATFSAAGLYVLRLRGDDGAFYADDTVEVRVDAYGTYDVDSTTAAWWTGSGTDLDAIHGFKFERFHGTNYEPGLVEQAFSFDGINDHAKVEANSALQIGASAAGFTIELWAKPSALHDTPLIEWERADGQADGFSLWENNSGSGLYGNLIDTNGSNHQISVGPGVFAVNTWVHVAMTYDRTTGFARLFKNGVLIAESNLGANLVAQTTYPVVFGGRVRDGRYFAGALDEITLYGRALSISEISAIYEAGAVGKGAYDGNRRPVINAGPDLQVSGTNTSTTLLGVATDDGSPAGGTFTVTWTMVAGPGTVTFGNAHAAQTTATFDTPGMYLLRLTGSDGAKQSSDVMTVRVGLTGTFEADSSLAAWWPGNGDPRDVLNGHDAELYNGTTYAAGQVAQAFRFDGGNDHARVAAHGHLNLGASAAGFTIEMWVNPSSLRDTPLIEWERIDGQSDGLSLWENNSGAGLYGNLIDTNGSNHQIAVGPGVFAVNTWVHVAFTYDRVTGFARLYKNGILIAESNLGAGITALTSYPIVFGGRVRDGRYFAGSLDEISLYSRPLTITEIATIVQSGAAGKNPVDNNLPPVVSAGPDVQIAGITSSAPLNGSITDDGQPAGMPVTAKWAKVDGPGLVTFASDTAAQTTATFDTAGTYLLRLTGSDGITQASDLMVVRVGQVGTYESDASLAAWWPGNGDPRDVVHGHDAELYNGMGYAAGTVSEAFALDGGNDHARVAAHADLNIGASAQGFTIEMWVKPSALRDTPLIEWERVDGQSDGLSLWENNSGSGLYGNIIDTTGSNHQIAVGPGVFALNTWVHVALTYDKTTGFARLYKNGLLIAESNLGTGFTPLTSYPIVFGGRVRDGRYFAGALDEISIYGRALSIGEIAAIYQSGAIGKNPVDDNAPPVVTAGPDQQIAGVGSVATLNGNVSDDGRPAGGSLVTNWVKLDGPGTVTFGDSHTPATTATFDAPGIYILQLSATDGGAQASDVTVVRVGVPGRVETDGSLAAWWPGNGDPREVVHGHDAELYNGVAFGGGEVSEAFVFDGINDHARVGAHADLNIGASTQGFTIELWAKPSALRDTPLIEWERVDGQSDGLSLWENNSGSGLYGNLIDTGGSNHQIAVGPGVFSTGTWVHVAFTYDRVTGYARLYKNGVLAAESNFGPNINPLTSYPIVLGGRVRDGRYYAGALDEISIYSRPLSVTEIAAVAQAGAIGKNPIDDNQPPAVDAGTDVQISGTGATATLAGSVSDDGRPTGSPLTIAWTKIAGPGTATFANAAAASTTAMFDTAGTYVLQLTASDGATITSDLAVVRVGVTGTYEADGSLAAWWPGNGDTTEVVHRHDLELYNGGTFAAGQVSQAFSFDGGNDHGRVGAFPELNIGASAAGFTIELWAKPSALHDTPLIEWERVDGQSDGLSLWENNSGSGLYGNLIDTGGSNHQIAVGPGVFAVDTWVHIAFTYDRVTGFARLYKNGTVVSETNLGAGITALTSYPIVFGGRVRDGRYFAGLLDEVTLYSRPLSVGEIATIYQAGLNGKNPFDDNQPPSVSAGPDLALANATDTATLNGAITDDGRPVGAVTAKWTKVDGPGNVTFADSTQAATTATFAAAGTYVLKLEANDGGATASDTVVVRAGVTGQFATDGTIAAWWPANSDPREVVNGNHDVELFNGAGYVTGRVGQAFSFDGANDHGRVAAHADLDLGASAAGFTIELWARPTSLRDTPIIEWERVDGQSDGLSLWENNSGSGLYGNLIDTNGSNHQIVVGPGVFAINTWVHVALTYEKSTGTARLFKNGSVAATTNLGANIRMLTTYPIVFGARLRDGRYFNGALDEVTFYNRALTPTEIGQIYAADAAGKLPLPGNAAPTIVFTDPPSGASVVVNTPVTLRALAHDTDGSVAKVEFFDGTTKIGESTSPDAGQPDSFTLTLGAGFGALGQHVLTAVATDSGNATVKSSVVVLNVAPVLPVVAVTSPQNNGSLPVGVATMLQATATYALGAIAKVEFYDGAGKLGESTTPASGSTYAFTVTGGFGGGTHLLRAKAIAVDTAAALSSPVTITATVVVPTVALTTPAANSSVPASVALTLKADATYAAGAIAKVEFYDGATKLGETAMPDAGSPSTYTFVVSGGITAGAHALSARVVAVDGSSARSGSVPVTANVAAPAVALTSPSNHSNVVIGANVSLTATATQASGTITKVEFYEGGTKLGETSTANAGNPSTYTFVVVGGFSSGAHVLSAKAYASVGTSATSAAITITGIQDTTPATVAILAPASAASITGPTPIHGTITSPLLSRWDLRYRRKNAPCGTWIAFGTGTNQVIDSDLATFDATLLPNGFYEIELAVTTTSGTATTQHVDVLVEGSAKVGPLTTTIEDLNLPMTGLPLTVRRTYNNQERCPGDFGYGWNLEVSTVHVETSATLGSGWRFRVIPKDFDENHPPAYSVDDFAPHVIGIMFPDGKTYRFRPVLKVQPGLQAPHRPFAPYNMSDRFVMQFESLPGTQGTLQVQGVPPEIFMGDNAPSDELDIDWYDRDVTTDPFGAEQFLDASGYVFTTIDGRKFTFDGAGKLTRLEDRDGNSLTITANGVFHSSGKSIVFVRDAQGRITKVTDPRGNDITYTYNGTGDLIKVSDRAGNDTTYAYDGDHNLKSQRDPLGVEQLRAQYDAERRLRETQNPFGSITSILHNLGDRTETITDPLGNSRTVGYSASGEVLSERDALGNTISYTYDGDGNRTSVTDALGNIVQMTYDANGRMTQMLSPENQVISGTFDSSSRPLTITDPRGGVLSFVYSATGNPLEITNALGHKFKQTYDAQGRVTSQEDPLGHRSTVEYDANGRISRIVDSVGAITTYTYDANGNRLTETKTRTRADGTTETQVRSTTYDANDRPTQVVDAAGGVTKTSYDAAGRVATVTDALNRVTTYGYDLAGRRTRIGHPDGTEERTTYDAAGRKLKSIDRSGRETSYTYDAAGRLTRTTNPDGTYTESTFNAIGKVTAFRDARGNVTTYAYDRVRRLTATTDAAGKTTTYDYDLNGNITKITDPQGRTVTYQYDAANQRTAVTRQDGSTTSCTYDAAGRVISRTSAGAGTRTYAYDNADRLISVSDGGSAVTAYTYDERGNLLTQTDALGHTTRFEYDAMGRRTKRILPGGQSETNAYDGAGNVISHRDFNGYTTTYVYDAANRLLEKIADPAHPSLALGYAAKHRFTYNADGQRTRQEVLNASGTVIYAEDFTYSATGRLQSKITPRGTLTYAYDQAGNLTQIQSSNGTKLAYEYDEVNRLSAAVDLRIDPRVDPTVNRSTTVYSYDPIGTMQAVGLPNGVTTGFVYDAMSRLTRLVSSGAASTIADYRYTLDASGARTQLEEGVTGRTTEWTYDNLHRLTGETITPGASGDPAPGGTVGYGYDVVGNRLQRTSNLGLLAAQTFSYDANDQLVGPTWDANGSTTSSVKFVGNVLATVTDVYDFENRLVQRSDTTGNMVSILYDAAGNRVAKTVNGSTTYFLVDQKNATQVAQVIEELAVPAGGTTPVVTRYYGLGMARISQSTRNPDGSYTDRYFGYDGLGTVRYLTDAAGTVTDRFAYDAFGVLLHHQGSTDSHYLYTGEQWDADLGMYYLRARYYEPQTGRFWTRDTYEGATEDPLSLHQYTYVLNNPVNLVDPSGNIPFLGTLMCQLMFNTTMGAVLGAEMGALNAGIEFILNPKTKHGSMQDLRAAIVAGTQQGAAMGATFGALFSVVPGPGLGLFMAGFFAGMSFASAWDALDEGAYGLAGYRAGMGLLSLLGAGPAMYQRWVSRSYAHVSEFEPLPPEQVNSKGPLRPPADPDRYVGVTNDSHLKGLRSEERLTMDVHNNLPDEVVVLWGKGSGTNGSDLVTVNQKTGEVTLWDSKFRSNPQNIPESPTFNIQTRRANAIAEATDAITADTQLPPNIRARALDNLQNNRVRTVTAGDGPGARNSTITTYP